MLEITTLTVGDLATNCYLVTDSTTTLTAVIDPGDDADFISSQILEKKLKPTCILLTHGHFDHVLGCLELQLNFKLPIFLHQKDEALYSRASASAKHHLKRSVLPLPKPNQLLQDGVKILIGAIELTTIHLPGHTPGSVAYYHQPSNSLFCGDLIFEDTVGRTDFSYSQPEELKKSIQKIKKLPDKTTIYPGHENPFKLA